MAFADHLVVRYPLFDLEGVLTVVLIGIAISMLVSLVSGCGSRAA
jgi:hypothetical protein